MGRLLLRLVLVLHALAKMKFRDGLKERVIFVDHGGGEGGDGSIRGADLGSRQEFSGHDFVTMPLWRESKCFRRILTDEFLLCYTRAQWDPCEFVLTALHIHSSVILLPQTLHCR